MKTQFACNNSLTILLIKITISYDSEKNKVIVQMNLSTLIFLNLIIELNILIDK